MRKPPQFTLIPVITTRTRQQHQPKSFRTTTAPPSHSHSLYKPPISSSSPAPTTAASSPKLPQASMSPLSTFLLLLLLHSTATSGQYQPLTLTVVNNCPFTIWPAIQPNAGSTLLKPTGFALKTLSHLSIPAPTKPWSGRIWARTHCTHSPRCFSCATGDCGNRVRCSGHGGATPATLAQFSLHHGGEKDDRSSYSVSLVDGFNLPMTVTPHEGKGRCPVVGCRVDVLKTCPECLKVRGGDGKVVGCRSGCGEFGTDELCCRNRFDSPQTCRSSSFSQFFKRKCPDTFTYAYDTPAVKPECSGPKELKVIFCH